MAKGCGQEYNRKWPRDCGQKEMIKSVKRLHSRERLYSRKRVNGLTFLKV
jgi:hypothetical protein